uniref:Uncharacterized protein n=1 Tax=Arundo donax TaxID=35708 RepID=A0A0A9H0M0_ARUDO
MQIPCGHGKAAQDRAGARSSCNPPQAIPLFWV